jgi:hypothetical protein
MLEDGGEVNNVFYSNLGANTLKATRPVTPDETDHLMPSTFWCTNPQNSWIGNIAAGSSDNGFWFELRDAVRGPTAKMANSLGMNPRTMPLGTFKANVAHSNGKHGLRTYPFGYLPVTEAVFVDNLSYRNMEDGFFLHNSKNIAISGGIIADNSLQIDLDRADAIRVDGTEIIGLSDSFLATIQSQKGVMSHLESLVGIQLHGRTFFDQTGARINGVKFSGFQGTGVKYVALVDIDDDMNISSFDYLTLISNVTIQGEVTPFQFDFSKALASGIDNAYIIDMSSSMKPNGSKARGVSSIVSSSSYMKTFLSNNDCQNFPDAGYMYCSETCIRTLLFSVNPSMTEDFRLRIINNAGLFSDIRGRYFVDTIAIKNDSLQKNREFIASLPRGSYKAYFHSGDGVPAWPTFVQITMKDALCSNSIQSDNVQLNVPVVGSSECQNLLKNGDFENSSLQATYWLQKECGMRLQVLEGISGSNALSDMIQTTSTGALGQFLDTRCLQRWQQYKIEAWVKVTVDGSTISCDSEVICPAAKLWIRNQINDRGMNVSETKISISSGYVRPYALGTWNLLHGILTIDASIAAASSVAFFVERQRTGAVMMIDSVSIRLIPKDCSQLVFNGFFDDGTSRFWGKTTTRDSLNLDMTVFDENWSLQMSGRLSKDDSPRQEIRIGCMSERNQYLATAKFRLLKSDRSPLFCNAAFSSGFMSCPRMILRSYVDVGLPTQRAVIRAGGSIAVTDHNSTTSGWYSMSGIFPADQFDVQADRLELFFDQIPDKATIVIDDVSITPLLKNCKDLIVNGNMEYDETPRFWRSWVNGGGKISLWNDVANNKILKFSDRAIESDGIYQFVNPICLQESKFWRFSARLKLTSSLLANQGIVCVPGDLSISKACPSIRVVGWKGAAVMFDKVFGMSNRPLWSADSFNNFTSDFPGDLLLASCDRVAVGIRQYNLSWDLFVDDVSLTPISI